MALSSYSTFLIRYFNWHFRLRFQQTTDRYSVRMLYLSVVYAQVPATVIVTNLNVYNHYSLYCLFATVITAGRQTLILRLVS